MSYSIFTNIIVVSLNITIAFILIFLAYSRIGDKSKIKNILYYVVFCNIILINSVMTLLSEQLTYHNYHLAFSKIIPILYVFIMIIVDKISIKYLIFSMLLFVENPLIINILFLIITIYYLVKEKDELHIFVNTNLLDIANQKVFIFDEKQRLIYSNSDSHEMFLNEIDINFENVNLSQSILKTENNVYDLKFYTYNIKGKVTRYILTFDNITSIYTLIEQNKAKERLIKDINTHLSQNSIDKEIKKQELKINIYKELKKESIVFLNDLKENISIKHKNNTIKQIRFNLEKIRRIVRELE